MNVTIAPTIAPSAVGRFCIIGGALMLVIAPGLLAGLLVMPKDMGGSNAVWFIGLLIIITAALTAAAIVYGGLNLSNPNEAFGLPAGSIRTLLAIGIMLLFAVFGLTFLDGSKNAAAERLSDKPIAEVELDAARVPEEVKRYQDAHFVVVVTSPGRIASTTGVTPVVDAARAKLQLFTRDKRKDPGAADLEKQILTAIITLLTSVIGFYFGSKSAAEGARAATSGETPSRQGGSPALLDMSELAARVTAQQKRFERLRAHEQPTEPDKQAAFRTALATLAATFARLEPLRKSANDSSLPDAERVKAFNDLSALSASFETQLADAERLIAVG